MTLMLGESPEPQRIPLQGSNLPLPSPDARFYGLVTSDPEILHAYLELLPSVSDPSARASLLNQLRENYVLLRGIDAQSFLAALENGLARELDPQLASLACSCLGLPLADLPADSRSAHEKTLLELSRSHSLPSCRLQLTRLLADVATDPGVTSAIYRIWQREDLAGFSEGDYMNLSYQLAIRMPDKAEEILRIQRARLDGSDPGRSFNADSSTLAAVPPARAGKCAILSSHRCSLLKAARSSLGQAPPWPCSATASGTKVRWN